MAATSEALQAENRRALARAVENVGAVLGAIGVGGKNGLADVGVMATNRVKQKLSQPGSGRVYLRGRVAHRASSPGQPPAVDTGRLRASYTWRTGEDSVGAFVEIGTNVVYAPFLEFGTRYMEARPHLRPVMEEIKGEIRRLVAQGIVLEQTAVIRRLPKEIR